MQYIIRNTNENYTSLNNTFTQDTRLEPATIGILTVILTNKPEWVVYPEEIAKRMKISRRTVNRHFQKLEEAGYMRVIKHSFGGNRGARTYRFFSDVPISDSYFEYLKDSLEKELSTGEVEK